MGNLESKLVTLLQEKRLKEALEFWIDHPELQAKVDPNSPMKYRWNHENQDTPLHCVARNGSKPLLWLLLNKGGDPFVRNAKGETPMHIVCTSSKHDSITNAVRADLLEVLLTKIPEVTVETTYEIISMEEAPISCIEDKLNLGVVDKARNTPLHLATASGLISCVEVLLAHGAPLSTCNMAGQTPCDVAVQANHLIIAKLLESRMVLKHKSNLDIPSSNKNNEKRIQTSEELKVLQDEVVARVSEKLNIPKCAAETLLETYGWSEELIMTSSENDRDAICAKAGLDRTGVPSYVKTISITDHECNICFGSCHGDVLVPCEHHVCRECLTSYLELQITEGGGKQIKCPETGCYKVIPNEVIKSLVSEDMYGTYTRLSLENFVSCYGGTKYCPTSGCDAIVALPEEVISSLKSEEPRQGVNVECSKGHHFCWTCSQEPHEPCSCDLWESWKTVLLSEGASALPSHAINIDWMLSCTKNCPQCRVPIEKNEGCNHMTCAKCRHEFCWLCLTPWREHGSHTGGYYSCNRYDKQTLAEKTAKEQKENLKKEVERNKAKFKHYCDRYNNHLLSSKIELELARKAHQKGKELSKMKLSLERNVAMVAERMPALQKDAGTSSTAAGVEDASEDDFLVKVTMVLLNARQVLASSYALGYFISDDMEEDKEVHETLQCTLEALVETLSQMVNRPYLCTPHSDMVVATRDVNHICVKYLQAMKQHGLSTLQQLTPTPPVNPPSPQAQLPRQDSPWLRRRRYT